MEEERNVMKKFRKWLYNTFLPAWAKSDLLAANEKLAAQLHEAREENARLQAYVDGLERGIRNQRRIIINTTGGNS